jgi:hypothetical protein
LIIIDKRLVPKNSKSEYLIQCFYAPEKIISQRPCPNRYEKKEEQANTDRTPPVMNKQGRMGHHCYKPNDY